eukprot:scaffold3710_cov286-Chaetoceros_neogracile.AAC.34
MDGKGDARTAGGKIQQHTNDGRIFPGLQAFKVLSPPPTTREMGDYLHGTYLVTTASHNRLIISYESLSGKETGEQDAAKLSLFISPKNPAHSRPPMFVVSSI